MLNALIVKFNLSSDPEALGEEEFELKAAQALLLRQEEKALMAFALKDIFSHKE